MPEEPGVLALDAVARAREGDGEAFAAIYDRYHRPLHAYATRLLGSTAAADDVVQEAFIQAWRALEQLRDEGRLEGWLYRIVSNKCFSALRWRKVRALLSLDWLPGGSPASGQGSPETVAERELVERALASLPSGQVACLLLRHVHGFSGAEIGEIMGLSPQAVWTRLSRAREGFAEAYRREARGERA